MASEVALITTCCICNGAFIDPRVLPCLHSFCHQCLETNVSKVDSIATAPPRGLQSSNTMSCDIRKHSAKQTFKCPTCDSKAKIPADGVSGFQENTLILTLSNQNTGSKETKLVTKEGQGKGNRNNLQNKSFSEKSKFDNEISNVYLGDLDENDLPTVHTNNRTHNGSQGHLKNGATTSQSSLQSQSKDEVSYHSREHLLEQSDSKEQQFLHRINEAMQQKSYSQNVKMIQMDSMKSHLMSNMKLIEREIESRAQKLCQVIQNQKNNLLAEVKSACTKQIQSYTQILEETEKLNKDIDTILKFGGLLEQHGSPEDVEALSDLMSDQMNNIIEQGTEPTADLLSMKLNVPATEREEQTLQKMFGSILQGNIQVGNAELVKSIPLDMNWPTGLVVTKHKEVVVSGKKGAFGSKGSVQFYDKNGTKIKTFEFPDGHTPCDVAVSHKDDILVTDNCGEILNFTSKGKLESVWTDKFKGNGHITVNKKENIIVTSPDEKQVHVYNSQALKLFSVPSDGKHENLLVCPNDVTTNEQGDIIVADYSQNAVLAFNAVGKHLFTYKGADDLDNGDMKCPSSVCCDPFDNILIGDFSNDRIHLVSKTGRFLGFLLTKENGISCPNFITFDHDGNLFVGQYGGEINVFQYLSYVKHI